MGDVFDAVNFTVFRDKHKTDFSSFAIINIM